MACNSVPWDIWKMLFRGFALGWHVISPGRSYRLGCVPVISPGMLFRGFVMHVISPEDSPVWPVMMKTCRWWAYIQHEIGLAL